MICLICSFKFLVSSLILSRSVVFVIIGFRVSLDEYVFCGEAKWLTAGTIMFFVWTKCSIRAWNVDRQVCDSASENIERRVSERYSKLLHCLIIIEGLVVYTGWPLLVFMINGFCRDMSMGLSITLLFSTSTFHTFLTFLWQCWCEHFFGDSQ